MQYCSIVLIAVGMLGCTRSAPTTAELHALRAELSAIFKTWTVGDGLRRPDGFVYTVDLAHAVEHAAHMGDQGWYLALQPQVQRVVINRNDDPYTAGFVAWRAGPGRFPDASGTTEGLHLARALLAGADAFDRPEDKAQARLLIDGYARHGFVDRGQWLIRNYFNFGTRSFANDSYLVDYDPDFVRLAAKRFADFENLAEQSAEAVRAARTQAGLIHTLMQPDIGTVMPDFPLRAFSPNDVVQFNNACWVAGSVAHSAPDVAHGVLRFANARWHDLRRYYFGRSGQPVTNQPADLAARTCIIRLAAELKAFATMDRMLMDVIPAWRGLPTDSIRRIYTLGEILLTLDAVLAARHGQKED